MLAWRQSHVAKPCAVAGNFPGDRQLNLQKQGPVDLHDGRRYAGPGKGDPGLKLSDMNLAFSPREGGPSAQAAATKPPGADLSPLFGGTGISQRIHEGINACDATNKPAEAQGSDFEARLN